MFSVFLTTSGIFLLTLSTWQYAISAPQCCYHSPGNMSLQVPATAQQSHWSSNCTELHKHLILSGIDLKISPTTGLILASIGLIVNFVLMMMIAYHNIICSFFPFFPFYIFLSFSYMLLAMGISIQYRVSLSLISLLKR